MVILSTQEAKAQLARLIERAAAGEEVVIAREGKPVARLVSYRGDVRPRTGGQWRGRVRIGDDFDAPLPPGISNAFDGKQP